MWILFKIIVFVGAFFFRLAGKYFSRFNVLHHEFNSKPYFIKLSKNKKTIESTTFGIDFKCTSIFKITKEGYFDRLFKGVMVVNEVQTGDPDFDASHYIASDDSTFRQMIKSDHDLRYAITQLFKNNCRYIFCDGSTLWVSFPGDQQENFFSYRKVFLS